jgi:glutathione S-transferase
VLWPVMSHKLKKSYRLTPERVERSHLEVDALLDRLDARVSTHEYLVGDRFSRADLAAAALFSSVLDPPERPWRMPVEMPADLDAIIEPYRDRPFWGWATRMYQKHRAPFRG